jgi:exonuclease III
MQSPYVLLCGDWNVVLDRYIDTYNIIHNRNPYSRKKIDEIIEAFELLDSWRIILRNSFRNTCFDSLYIICIS